MYALRNGTGEDTRVTLKDTLISIQTQVPRLFEGESLEGFLSLNFSDTSKNWTVEQKKSVRGRVENFIRCLRSAQQPELAIVLLQVARTVFTGKAFIKFAQKQRKNHSNSQRKRRNRVVFFSRASGILKKLIELKQILNKVGEEFFSEKYAECQRTLDTCLNRNTSYKDYSTARRKLKQLLISTIIDMRQEKEQSANHEKLLAALLEYLDRLHPTDQCVKEFLDSKGNLAVLARDNEVVTAALRALKKILDVVMCQYSSEACKKCDDLLTSSLKAENTYQQTLKDQRQLKHYLIKVISDFYKKNGQSNEHKGLLTACLYHLNEIYPDEPSVQTFIRSKKFRDYCPKKPKPHPVDSSPMSTDFFKLNPAFRSGEQADGERYSHSGVTYS